MNPSEALLLETHHEARQDQWQKEKTKLIAALTARLLQGRDYISLAEIKNSPFFLALNAQNRNGEFLLATLSYNARQVIRQEKPLVLQSKRQFDLDDEELRIQLRQLRDLLAERLTFDKDQLQAALSLGVRLQFDLITQPRTAIEKLIYPQPGECKKEDVVTILQGLGENRPFLECLQSLLADHSDESITKETFSGLCQRAEVEVYGNHLVSSMIADLKDYENFCKSVDVSYSGRIDSQSVLAMLHARGRRDLAETLLSELPQEANWPLSEIARALNARIVITESPAPVEEADAAASSPEYDLGEFIYEATAEEEKPSLEATVSDNRVLIEEQTSLAFQEEEEFPGDGGGMEKPGSPEAASETSYAEDDAEDLQLVNRAKIEAQPPGPYPSLTQLIDEKNRRVFIKKIFQKDLDTYLSFVERLEAIKTWKEAKAFLDHEFQQRRVNPYSKEAIRLSDVVFKRYFAKR